ncbi:MAG: group II intron reverse transcriptase/maturase [Bacteroidota bacterium]
MDTAIQSPGDWLLNIQRKLYQWSREHPEEAYRDLWNWVTDERNLRLAWGRVATNKGRSTPGVDGVTVNGITKKKGMGAESFLRKLQERLRAGEYYPSPVRRKWIPKPGKPDQCRGLGIPTVEDRVVQSAVLQIIEPIFEARFLHVSMGFRPGRAVRDAIELIRRTARCMKTDENGKKINPPYQWVIEGDIQGCFDNIDHHALMNRVRRGIRDRAVTRLITAFLKAGIMEEGRYSLSKRGTPQGGILSPLLANIALSVIEERYRRWLQPTHRKDGKPYRNPFHAATSNRRLDRLRGKPVFYPIRYADDFILISAGSEEEILEEKHRLAEMLQRELGLELSQEKTRITTLKEGFHFLGHHIRLRENERWGWVLQALIPLDRQSRLRYRIKDLTKRQSIDWSLGKILRKLNPIIRGWGNFYRHTNGAYGVFRRMDYFIFMRIFHWLRKKHRTQRWNYLYRKLRKKGRGGGMSRWTEGRTQSVQLLDIPRCRWDLKNRKIPVYMFAVGEPSA